MLTVSLTKKTMDLFECYDELTDLAFKTLGGSISEVIKGMDAKTGALIGGSIEAYETTKRLIVDYAEVTDKMIMELKEIKIMNNCLREQNKILREILQSLTPEDEKTGEEKGA